ncbi:hypothetical protein DWX43_25205 [Clostridium sp. AF19-22AC]|uniref:hypothetical protein n=1 Tax=Clostridia TaxID=186801 RepID=UPI000E54E621|nr:MULTISPECIES: hypothetical protein [Clostridia]RHR20940.1 hypothetical protein DWX43_25205 [Clostridium sp. AF19-22AC]
MFILLTVIAIVSVIYCVDIPIINENFQFMVNNHDSMLYGVVLSIIAAYIFYILQVAIPEKIRAKQNRDLIYPKLQTIERKMESIIKIIYPSFSIENTIEKESILKQLNDVNLFTDGTQDFYNRKEVTKMEALYKNCDFIHNKILEVLIYRTVDKNIRSIIGKLDESNLKSIIFEMYKEQPGILETITPKGAKASIGLCIVNTGEYYERICYAFMEYIDLYKKLVKITKDF